MLKSIMRAVAAFMRAVPRFVLQRVRVAGEWIMRLVAVPTQVYEPEPAPIIDRGVEEHLNAIRTAAGHLYVGDVPPPAAMALLSKDDVVWLGTMSKRMQSLVVAASDNDLRAHMRCKRMIPGLLNRDPAAVAEYRRAHERQRMTPQERQEMRRAAA